MKRVNKCIENKKEKYNANKIARIFLSSPLKLGLAIALSFIFFLIFSTFVLADLWAPSKPSHGTLYADTITSKTDGSPVNIADAEGLFVTANARINNFYLYGTDPGNVPALWSNGGAMYLQPVAGDWVTAGYIRGNGLLVGGGGGNGELKVYGQTYLAGNVGIGTTNPLDKLSVAGSIGVGGAGFDNPGGVSGQGIAFPSTTNDAQRIYGEHNGGDISNLIIEQRDNTDDAVIFRQMDCCGAGTLDYMRIARDGMHYIGGNVGIGTVAPAGKLDVSATDGKHIILSEGISDYGEIGYGFNVGNKASLWMGVNLNSVSLTPTQSDTANPSWFAKFNTNTDDFRISRIAPAGATSDFLFITSSGNVGIGTTSPATKLDIDWNVAGTPSAYLLRLQNSAGTNAPRAQFGIEDYMAKVMTLSGKVGGAGLAQIMSWNLENGNVGIGTTNPFSDLELSKSKSGGSVFSVVRNTADTASSNAGLNIVSGGSSAGDPYVIYTISGVTNWAEGIDNSDSDSFKISAGAAPGSGDVVTITTAGSVGIGTTNPNFKLEVAGSAGKPGGGSWSDSSDIRLKKNIKPIANALDKMLALNGVTYQWKEPQKHGNLTGKYMGMIANDVEKSFPEWVGTGKDGYKTLGFIGFEALTVESMRELKEEIEALKTENNKKDKELQELKSEINKIKKI